MNIELTPAAAQQISLIAGMEVIETGFLFGSTLGKYIIIEQLFPVNFNEKNIAEIYAKIIAYKDKNLLGVFFNNREFFPNDWFLEDVIMKINPTDRQPESFIYDSQKKLISLTFSRNDWKMTAARGGS